MSGIYEFSTNDAYRFADSVSADTRKVGGELVFRVCPYCKSTKDKKTFSINLSTGQFECKRASCGAKGNMITLAKDFSREFELTRDVSTYYKIEGRALNYKKFRDAHKAIEVRDSAIEYLQSRGIPEEVTRRYEVTSDPEHPNNIIFPFKDQNGELCFYKVRNSKFNGEGSKEWCVAGDYKKILFGMNNCEDFETLVITEGQIDSLSCTAAGIKNAVSVPTGKKGFTWKVPCWDWLIKFKEIVVFGDHENGEITLSAEISQFFPKKVRTVKVQDYKGCKDANELLNKHGAEALVKAVNNAEVVIPNRIKALEDIEAIDLNKLKAYPTHYKAIDKAIGNGFHEGEVIILTGKCGEGKSTFASMIVGRMIQNGLKCFCYSGELPDWMFKSWLDYQVLGSKHFTEGIREKANEWYKGKCWLYDNSSVVDEGGELFELLEFAAKKLECKFFLIDNLMTAMEDKPQEDLFRQQSAFLGRLTKFAKGYNVIVMLIAHPRKGSDMSNDSISGSGDITNRANLVFRYQRKQNEQDGGENSILMITKNRTTGQLITSGIEMEYDPDSMRITQKGEAECEPFIIMTEDEKAEISEAEVMAFMSAEDIEDIPF